MQQSVPEITEDDVRPIVLRDLGDVPLPEISVLLNKCGISYRVQAAALKLANGEIESLREACDMAVKDYRDVLAYAEYPRYMREVRFVKIDEASRQAIIADDWEQYQEGLKTA